MIFKFFMCNFKNYIRKTNSCLSYKIDINNNIKISRFMIVNEVHILR